jgi:hypothetical protein
VIELNRGDDISCDGERRSVYMNKAIENMWDVVVEASGHTLGDVLHISLIAKASVSCCWLLIRFKVGAWGRTV